MSVVKKAAEELGKLASIHAEHGDNEASATALAGSGIMVALDALNETLTEISTTLKLMEYNQRSTRG